MSKMNCYRKFLPRTDIGLPGSPPTPCTFSLLVIVLQCRRLGSVVSARNLVTRIRSTMSAILKSGLPGSSSCTSTLLPRNSRFRVSMYSSEREQGLRSSMMQYRMVCREVSSLFPFKEVSKEDRCTFTIM